MNLTFKSDTKHRSKFQTAVSFSHPAKMVLPLQRWIIEQYTVPGETILDPMSGSGTLLIACTMGRNVICVELEQKFINMIEANYQKVQTLGPEMGYSMGTAQIIHGDARNLPELLCDSIISSPPYEGSVSVPDSKPEARTERLIKSGYDPKQYQGGTGRNLQQDWHYADIVVTSPPYEQAQSGGGISAAMRGEGNYKVTTSLPSNCYQPSEHGQSQENIGNLKGQSYLDAMRLVYQGCHRVLKPSGKMILVTKNYIRNKEIQRLDLDTITLCEEVGFKFIERHERTLTQQSFWRTLYANKYPEVPQIDTEDILVMEK